ncbi:sulfotransferase [Cryomorphaceae bacterium 1068]|nr:sulfotransferase [Cryomorphaceae bacterium 1068]
MTTDKQLPNFFVVGVVKGGTTSLYHYLAQHPDVYLPPIKETNHFASSDISEKDFLKGYAQDVNLDLDRYIKGGMKETIHIAHVNEDHHYNALFSKVEQENAIGEISNSYMICPNAAKAIYDFNPEAKILVILRNPIRRAWSQFLMNLREAKSDADNFIQELENDHAQNPKGWGVNHQYLELGKYSDQLKRYFDLFGKDQVLPIFFEDYKKSPDDVLASICTFLEIDASFEFDFSEKSNASALPRNAGLNRFLVNSGIMTTAKKLTPKPLRQKLAGALYSDKNMPKLQEADAKWLRDYYQNEVGQLSELLEIDITKKWPEFGQ